MYTESCVKEKLQHNNNNNKVEFVFLCTHGHPFCELVVVPTPPTFAATIWAIRLSKTNSGSFLFFNFTLKPGNDGRRKTTQILLIASTEKNLVGRDHHNGYCKSFEREIDRDRQKN
jgi:hypothetical protein